MVTHIEYIGLSYVKLWNNNTPVGMMSRESYIAMLTIPARNLTEKEKRTNKYRKRVGQELIR